MRQAGMKVDTCGYEIISSKHLAGKCVIKGRHKNYGKTFQTFQSVFRIQTSEDKSTSRSTHDNHTFTLNLPGAAS